MGRGTWVATAAATVTATKHYLVGATGCGSGVGDDDDPRPSLILPAQKVRARERDERRLRRRREEETALLSGGLGSRIPGFMKKIQNWVVEKVLKDISK